jgi:hypothetical protein
MIDHGFVANVSISDGIANHSIIKLDSDCIKKPKELTIKVKQNAAIFK